MNPKKHRGMLFMPKKDMFESEENKINEDEYINQYLRG